MASPDPFVHVAEVARERGFSGVARVTIDGRLVLDLAEGLADRERGVANASDTRFAIASGTKLLTALAVGRLVDRKQLALDARARDLLPPDLAQVDPQVTVEHLLAHVSGVYDYYDEELVDDFDAFELAVPPDRLESVRDYLPMLAGPMKFAPGVRFSYSNGGYVLLGLIIEAASGMGYHDFVEREVMAPAGMARSGFFRFDRLPEATALGYVRRDGDWTTNQDKLPIIGGPDGGAYASAADIERLWLALFDDRLLSPELRARFVAPAATVDDATAYGLGVWIRTRAPGAHYLEGCDAGVSFKSTRFGHGAIATVIANTTEGAWPVADAIDEALGEALGAMLGRAPAE